MNESKNNYPSIIQTYKSDKICFSFDRATLLYFLYQHQKKRRL